MHVFNIGEGTLEGWHGKDTVRMTPLGTAQSRTGRRRRLLHLGCVSLRDLQSSGRLCCLYRLHRFSGFGNRSVGKLHGGTVGSPFRHRNSRVGGNG